MDKMHLYNTRQRMNTRSPGAREESSSNTHGTSPLPSMRRFERSSSEMPYDYSDEERSESSDSEQHDKILKKLKHKANAKLLDKSTKENACAQPYGFTTNAVPYALMTDKGTYGCTTSKGTNSESCRCTAFKRAIVEAYGSATSKGTNSEPCKRRAIVEPSKRTNVIVILSIVVLAAAVVAYFSIYSSYRSLQDRKSQLQETFRKIRKQFPSQEDDLWPALFSGIKEVEEDPLQPSTFLLLHELEEDETPKCLAVKMSKAATAFLEATDPSPLKLEGEELGVNDSLIRDHGILISEQKENITNHRAVIVFNLHKIPASVAQCFHYFCDEYNPVVQKAVYFFTMSIGKKSHGSPTHIAESELKKLWRQQLETDKLQPLIVRLTTSVMVIKPEKDLTSCDS